MLTIERLIEDELFIVCPPISAENFINYCKERDISVGRDDLELYEKLGIFYPIARVELPKYRKKIEYNIRGVLSASARMRLPCAEMSSEREKESTSMSLLKIRPIYRLTSLCWQSS